MGIKPHAEQQPHIHKPHAEGHHAERHHEPEQHVGPAEPAGIEKIEYEPVETVSHIPIAANLPSDSGVPAEMPEVSRVSDGGDEEEVTIGRGSSTHHKLNPQSEKGSL